MAMDEEIWQSTRLPSKAGAEFSAGSVSVPAMRQMYGSDVEFASNGDTLLEKTDSSIKMGGGFCWHIVF